MPKFSRNSLTFHRLGESYHFLKVYASNVDFLQYYAANVQKARFLSSSS
jgi:hypothetical protein